MTPSEPHRAQAVPPEQTHDLPSHPAQRLLDWLVAVPACLVSLPIIAVAGAAVKLTSRGPMLYSQIRAGRGGRPFRIYKLRTMHHNCESESGACWSTKGDPRVTPVGRWLRKLHIDELPQLFNVLSGDMSVVGPRPERPEILRDLQSSIPDVHDRLHVRPGVTGLAQIQQPPDVTSDCFRRKLLYDRHYIRRRGLATDLRILFGTGVYLLGMSYDQVRRLAGLTVPLMPNESMTFREAPAAVGDAAAAPILESSSGVPG